MVFGMDCSLESLQDGEAIRLVYRSVFRTSRRTCHNIAVLLPIGYIQISKMETKPITQLLMAAWAPRIQDSTAPLPPCQVSDTPRPNSQASGLNTWKG
jgi:hypothetical protein